VRASWHRQRQAWVAALLGLLAAGTPQDVALAQQEEEMKFRAAYVYNFAQFTEWPAASFPSPSDPLTIGVLGPGSLAQDLSSLLQSRSVRGRSLRVRFLKDVLEGRSCHIVLISGSASGRPEEVAAALGGRAVLTIGDGEEFARSGGIIGLFIAEKRLRFAINQKTASKSGLRLSAKLLALARLVEPGEER
jgi:hypothetical protein